MRSSVIRYSVPPSARVIDFAAVRIVSSRRLMSRSAESEAPIALSCSRRWTRSSAAARTSVPKRSAWVPSRVLLMRSGRGAASLDADRAHFLDVRDARQALLHAVLLEGAHALLQADGQDVGDARVLLDR